MEGKSESGGQGDVVAVSDPHHIRAGLKTIQRAFTERWPIPPERRQRILTVLQQIVETDTFEVEKNEVTDDGKSSEVRKVGSITMPNHRNQVAAAKVILAAAKLDQDDLHHIEGGKSNEAKISVTVLNIQPPRVIGERVIVPSLNGASGGD